MLEIGRNDGNYEVAEGDKGTDEMNEQFIQEYITASETGNFKQFAENWGLTVEEAHETAKQFPALEQVMPSEGSNEVMDMNSDSFKPDYTATAKYEGPGKDDVTIDTSGDIDATLLGMVGPQGKVKVAKGMFDAGKKLMSTKGGKVSDLLMKPPGIGKGVAKKVVKKPAKVASEKAMQKQLGKAIGTAGIATAIGLSGNRNKDGDFVEAPVTDQGEEFYTEPTQPKPKVDLNEIARNDHSVGEENPWVTNQHGYHKRPGQNFWTIDDSDPYWDTHEMGTGNAFEGSALKEAPRKELDWSSWF